MNEITLQRYKKVAIYRWFFTPFLSQNDKKTRFFLAAGNHAKAYANVLYRSHLVYGKSTE